MVHYLGFYPLPNGRDFGDGTGEFFNGPNQPTTEDYFTVRLDHQFSDKNILFVRYSIDEADIEKQEPLGVFADFSFSRYQSLAVELKTILSPTLINSVRFGGNRTFSKSDGLPVNPPGPNSLVPGQPFGGLTVGEGTGSAPISFMGSSNDRWFPYTTETYSDDINWTRGAHGIQIGGSVQ